MINYRSQKYKIGTLYNTKSPRKRKMKIDTIIKRMKKVMKINNKLFKIYLCLKIPKNNILQNVF